MNIPDRNTFPITAKKGDSFIVLNNGSNQISPGSIVTITQGVTEWRPGQNGKLFRTENGRNVTLYLEEVFPFSINKIGITKQIELIDKATRENEIDKEILLAKLRYLETTKIETVNPSKFRKYMIEKEFKIKLNDKDKLMLENVFKL